MSDKIDEIIIAIICLLNYLMLDGHLRQLQYSKPPYYGLTELLPYLQINPPGLNF